MSAYITTARRAAIAALLVIAAACSSDKTPSAPAGQPDGKPDGKPPVDTSITPPPPVRSVASIQLSGDREVVHTYMGWLQAKPVDAEGQPMDAAVTWSSSDPSILTVDAVGAMIGKQPGKAIITAQASGKSATTEVVVVPRRATYLQTSNETSTLLQRGDVGSFGVLALDQHRQLINDAAIVYTSSDPSIIEVRGSALYPIRAGQVTITATVDGVSATRGMRVASATVYPLRMIDAKPLPHVLLETVEQLPSGTVKHQLIATGGSITFSNTEDRWTQRIAVEEWEISESGGNTISRMIAVSTSTSSGSWAFNAGGNIRLPIDGSTAEPLWGLWMDEMRSVRIWKYWDAEGPAMRFDYAR